MLEDNKQNTKLSLDSIQRVVLGLLLAILPISILPFPWDLTEKGMSIVLLSFSTIIIAIELIKVIWSGRFSLVKKNSDIIIFSLFVAILLSTIFSGDASLSIWGLNNRLSQGLIGISIVLLITYVIRSFITERKHLLFIVNTFLIGSILTSFLSLVSLFGGNILSIIPKISSLAQIGLPIVGSPVVLVIYNCVAIFLSVISLELLKSKQLGDSSWFSIIALLVNAVSLVIFSQNGTSILIVGLFFLIWIGILLVVQKKDKSKSKQERLSMFLIPVSILIVTLLMQIDGVAQAILGESVIYSPIKLSVNFSWQIVSQALMASLKNGIFGFGLDGFGVLFNAYKPISFTNVDMSSGFNEIFTSLTSAGFLWLIIWLILGWYILKDLIRSIREYKKENIVLVLLDTLLLFVYLTSFLTSYTLLIRFLLFLLLSIGVIYRNILRTDDVDSLLIKVWAMGTGKAKQKETPSLNIFITCLVAVSSILILVKLGSITISSLYLLRAESYIVEENEKYVESTPTLDERTNFVENLYRWYKIAYRYDKNNPVVNRKLSLIATDMIGINFDKYEKDQNEQYLNDIVFLRSEALEYSKAAINISPSVYANYKNRALIYLGLVNLGYKDYIRDGISALQEATFLKPLDYESYYNIAQLYYLLENNESALSASNQALSINGAYIPALILSSNIYGSEGNVTVQLSYLEAIKTVLESNGQQDSELYESVMDQIDLIDVDSTDVTSEDTDTEASLETE